MGRIVTQADMDSRRRMCELQVLFSDCLTQVEGITYAELLCVLGNLCVRWAGQLRKEELEDE